MASLPNLTAWRIVKKRYAKSAFDGDGARRFGGRWNSPGVPMVYVASSRSLAVLEMAVHLDPPALLSSFVLIPCEFDQGLVTTLDRSLLPVLWRRDPPLPDLAAIGDAWVKQARSAALAVPSAVIDEELNYLLNPMHPDFPDILIGSPRDFSFDARLIQQPR